MSGKIFTNSANIFQDQAKIMFDYYKQAAEKIVSEEEKYEKEIALCRENIAQWQQEIAKAKQTKTICFVLFFLLVPIYFGIMAHLKMKELQIQIDDNYSKIEQFETSHKEIFRDYKVNKLGVAYVPIAAQIPFEDKSFMIDFTSSVNTQNFNLNTLKQAELFTNTVTDLDELMKEAPIVEKSDEAELVNTDDYSLSIQNVTYHDYFGKIDRTLRTSSFCLQDLDLTSVSLPVILPDSDHARFIDEHATAETGNAPVFNIFDSTTYQDEIARFHSLNEMKKSLEKHQIQFEEVLKTLMMNMANSVQAISQVKIASTNTMVDSSNKTLFKILKCSYNHYSPNLESDEIERIRNEQFNYQDSAESYEPFQLKPSSKVKYDIMSDCWIAEDGSKTNFPFGVHQIHEEIVAPIVHNLMQETRLERLKIYNNIKDQKIDYLNQWHRDTEDFYARNRAESNDLINIMRSTLSEYISSYNAMIALKKTEENLENNSSIDASLVKSEENEADVFAAFDAKSKDFKMIQNDFMEYMDRLKEDIDRRAEKFEYIEYYDASLRDTTFKEYAVASGRINTLDSRRMPLAAVNPFFAETSELPPPPSIENMTYEHMSINLPKIARAALDELSKNVEPVESSIQEQDHKTKIDLTKKNNNNPIETNVNEGSFTPLKTDVINNLAEAVEPIDSDLPTNDSPPLTRNGMIRSLKKTTSLETEELSNMSDEELRNAWNATKNKKLQEDPEEINFKNEPDYEPDNESVKESDYEDELQIMTREEIIDALLETTDLSEDELSEMSDEELIKRYEEDTEQ